MAARLVRDVFEKSAMTGIDRLVLLALADYARKDDGKAWPSITTLQERSTASRRAVIRALDRAVIAGEIVKVSRGRKGIDTNMYQFTGRWCLTGTSAPQTPVPDGLEVVPDRHLGSAPQSPRTVIEPITEPPRAASCVRCGSDEHTEWIGNGPRVTCSACSLTSWPMPGTSATSGNCPAIIGASSNGVKP